MFIRMMPRLFIELYNILTRPKHLNSSHVLGGFYTYNNTVAVVFSSFVTQHPTLQKFSQFKTNPQVKPP